MRIRDYKMVKTQSVTITVRKDENHYKSTYSVCLFSKSANIRVTCPNRQAAKEEFTRLMRLYTNVGITQIMRM
jgi:hypothetical protein